MNLKPLIKGCIFLLTFTLASCGNDLRGDLETYEEDTEKLNNLQNDFNDIVSELDLTKLQSMHYDGEDVDLEFLQSLDRQVEEELLPITDELIRELEDIEVPQGSELSDAHNILKESVQVKRDFAKQLSDFLNAYAVSLDSNEQLITLSQSFITHQQERDDIIESAETAEEIEEINGLIEVLNENSTDLDEHSEAFYDEKSVSEREQYINDHLLPLIDNYISSLNELNLTTEKATRARTISLEMYYNYRTYFEERKNVMLTVDKLQNVPLQNILPLIETMSTLEEQYTSELENKKNEAR